MIQDITGNKTEAEVKVFRDNNNSSRYLEQILIEKPGNSSYLFSLNEINNIVGNCTCEQDYHIYNDLQTRIYFYKQCNVTNVDRETGNYTIQNCSGNLNYFENYGTIYGLLLKAFEEQYIEINCQVEFKISLIITVIISVFTFFFIVIGIFSACKKNQILNMLI